MSRLSRSADGPPDEDRVREIATRRARSVVEGTDKRVDRVEADLAVVRVDLERISHQLRAVEQRLDAAAAGTDDAPASPADPDGLLAEVRREHAQIRVRFQMMSRYEERLRRLEDAVVKLYGGDLRGPGRSG
jgi:hypothetical protein